MYSSTVLLRLRNLLVAIALFNVSVVMAEPEGGLDTSMIEAFNSGESETLKKLSIRQTSKSSVAISESLEAMLERITDEADLAGLQQMVADGYELNPADWHEHPLRQISPYTQDVSTPHLEMMEWIIQQTGPNEDYGLLLNDFVENDHLEGVQVLLEGGTNPNLWRTNNRSAWDLAESDEMRALLDEYGATSSVLRAWLYIIVFAAVIGLLIWFFLYKRRKAQPSEEGVAAKPERNRAKGLRYILIGAGIVLVASFSVLLFRYGSVFGLSRPGEGGGIIIIIAVFASIVGARMITIGKGLRTPDGDEIIEKAARPLFLYLRSFALDEEDGKHSMPLYLGARVPINPWESSVASACGSAGDLVAIGRPGEEFATVGAARVYVTDDQWQDKVIELVEKTEIVFWTYGESEGLRWEIERLVATVPPEQLVLALPFWEMKPAKRAEVWSQIRENLQAVFPKGLPEDIAGSLFISFDADWNAKAVPPKPTPMYIRAAMLFGRNHIIEGIYGLLEARGYKLPEHGIGTYLLCLLGFLAWTTVLCVLLVMFYSLFMTIFY